MLRNLLSAKAKAKAKKFSIRSLDLFGDGTARHGTDCSLRLSFVVLITSCVKKRYGPPP